MLLTKTYFPTHELNRMKNEGDLASAREYFFKNRPNNLVHLLSNRYSWMNQYLQGKSDIIEIGSGAGFAKEFIENSNFQLTDFVKHKWIDKKVDALNTPYEDNSLDAVISSHMIHHLAQPVVFFREMNRILKPGGYLIIQEINASYLMRVLLRMMRHEGWSFDADVFDENTISNDPNDPWSANCAIPRLLWDDQEKFEKNFPEFKVLKNELCECITFPISGGVIAKTKTIQLPRPVLKFIDLIDYILIKLFPRVFALGRSVVLEKK